MENREPVINETNKVTETLTKELESLNNEELHAYSNKALGLNENIDELVRLTEGHIKGFS